MIITVSKTEGARASGKGATLLGKDVISVFNRVRTGWLAVILEENSLQGIATYCKDFLAPRRFPISLD